MSENPIEQSELWDAVERGLIVGGIEDKALALVALRLLQERYAGECVWTRTADGWGTKCGYNIHDAQVGLMMDQCRFCGNRIREAENVHHEQEPDANTD